MAAPGYAITSAVTVARRHQSIGVATETEGREIPAAHAAAGRAWHGVEGEYAWE